MTGTVLPFAGSAAPTGWLLCYGQAVSRTTYATLFAVIGTTFGAGDGSTLGANGGSDRHQLTAAQMPSHTHAVNNAASTTIGGAYTTASLNAANGLQAVTVAAGGDAAHPNAQPTIVLNSIIKA